MYSERMSVQDGKERFNRSMVCHAKAPFSSGGERDRLNPNAPDGRWIEDRVKKNLYVNEERLPRPYTRRICRRGGRSLYREGGRISPTKILDRLNTREAVRHFRYSLGTFVPTAVDRVPR